MSLSNFTCPPGFSRRGEFVLFENCDVNENVYFILCWIGLALCIVGFLNGLFIFSQKIRLETIPNGSRTMYWVSMAQVVNCTVAHLMMGIRFVVSTRDIRAFENVGVAIIFSINLFIGVTAAYLFLFTQARLLGKIQLEGTPVVSHSQQRNIKIFGICAMVFNFILAIVTPVIGVLFNNLRYFFWGTMCVYMNLSHVPLVYFSYYICKIVNGEVTSSGGQKARKRFLIFLVGFGGICFVNQVVCLFLLLTEIGEYIITQILWIGSLQGYGLLLWINKPKTKEKAKSNSTPANTKSSSKTKTTEQ